MRLVGEHALFGGAAAPALLAANFFEACALGVSAAFPARFNLVEQQLAGEKTIQALLARALAFDLQSGREMDQHHASRGLVDVLATVTTRADKSFFDVGFAHAECGHPLRELIFLFEADGK